MASGLIYSTAAWEQHKGLGVAQEFVSDTRAPAATLAAIAHPDPCLTVWGVQRSPLLLHSGPGGCGLNVSVQLGMVHHSFPGVPPNIAHPALLGNAQKKHA